MYTLINCSTGAGRIWIAFPKPQIPGKVPNTNLKEKYCSKEVTCLTWVPVVSLLKDVARNCPQCAYSIKVIINSNTTNQICLFFFFFMQCYSYFIFTIYFISWTQKKNNYNNVKTVHSNMQNICFVFFYLEKGLYLTI